MGGLKQLDVGITNMRVRKGWYQSEPKPTALDEA